ncbi:MAG TPA: hypothetical protein VJZ01_05855, partial [Lachnospiraceae bacterium]|nr:hypothetical protein [Lachnospiraceae bacterium]
MSKIEGFLSKNIEAFRKRYPDMVDVIVQAKAEDIEVGIDDAYGKKVLYAIKDDETYQLDTLYDTESLMELWFQNLPRIYYRAKIIMFGLGNGMYVRKLLSEIPSDVTVIVYEPKACILQKVIEEFDISDLIQNEQFVLLLDDAMVKTPQEYLYELFDYTDIDSFIYKAYLNYNRLFTVQFMEYMETLQIALSSINSTQNVIGRFGKIYYENTFANMKCFLKSKSFESLVYKTPKDVPAIVVAA